MCLNLSPSYPRWFGFYLNLAFYTFCWFLSCFLLLLFDQAFFTFWWYRHSNYALFCFFTLWSGALQLWLQQQPCWRPRKPEGGSSPYHVLVSLVFHHFIVSLVFHHYICEIFNVYHLSSVICHWYFLSIILSVKFSLFLMCHWYFLCILFSANLSLFFMWIICHWYFCVSFSL